MLLLEYYIHEYGPQYAAEPMNYLPKLRTLLIHGHIRPCEPVHSPGLMVSQLYFTHITNFHLILS